MPSICDEPLDSLVKNQKTFHKSVLRGICEIIAGLLGGGSTTSGGYAWQQLAAPNTNLPVLVRFTYDPTGAITTIAAFNLDGTDYAGNPSLLVFPVNQPGNTQVNFPTSIMVEPGNNPLNVNIVSGGGGSGSGITAPVYQFAEQLAVPSASETVILTYVPAGVDPNIQGILVSGQSAGRYKLKVNGVTKAIVRTTAAEMTKSVFFSDGTISVLSGDTVTVTGYHEETGAQNLSASLFGYEDVPLRPPFNDFNEDPAVISGIETTILSYTSVGMDTNIQGILVSGQAAGRYKFKVNGSTRAIVRTTAAKMTEFVTFDDGSIAVILGEVATLTAYHEETANQAMSGNIFGYTS